MPWVLHTHLEPVLPVLPVLPMERVPHMPWARVQALHMPWAQVPVQAQARQVQVQVQQLSPGDLVDQSRQPAGFARIEGL